MPPKIAEETQTNPKQRYMVKTPINPEYSGKVFGVRFENGRGVIDPDMLDTSLGWTMEDILRQLRDMEGYTVEPIN